MASTASPTGLEPVNDRHLTTGCWINAWPGATSPETMLNVPGGTVTPSFSLAQVKHSSKAAAMVWDDSGMRCDGFQTTVLPTTKAATTWAMGMATGKLNGVMMAATPRGSKRDSITTPSMFFW